MDNSKTLLIITVVAILLIYLVKRRKWKKEIFTVAEPRNIGIKAVFFFEQFLAFLPKIGAKSKKGTSLLDGIILMQAEERGAYIVSEKGGLITYLGLSTYFSIDPEYKKLNDACENLMFYVLNLFIKDKGEAKSFYSHLIGGVLDFEEEESIIETKSLHFRFGVEHNYSQASPEEVPDMLKHIKGPVVFILEVLPIEA